MTDIVERLWMDADNANPYCIDQDSIMEAADTIEALRKQVSELEYQSNLRAKVAQSWADKVGVLYQELAAIKWKGEKE